MSIEPAPAEAAPRIAAFANSYARLPEHWFARHAPVPVAEPRLIRFNSALAAELGLDIAAIEAAGPALLFGGNLLPLGAEPLALAYAGHQFGNFVPRLGDGRAVLLGEVIDLHGVRRDIQLKGAGPTPFSRGGDGRAALGPVLREYLVSEAMHALGVPTTRALAAVSTGESIYREEILPGAVLTRVAGSHVRVGTFQYFAARGDETALRQLVDYVILRHYPAAAEAEIPALALLEAVIERQAALIARWMQLGFIHGVMNTDNMAVSGETLDYGPCAFMDAYDPATVFSAIDRFGRYAYANQPRLAQWDLERAVERATEAVTGFSERYEGHWLAGMRAKLGLHEPEDGDRDLITSLLDLMHQQGADFTLTFRRLADGSNLDASGAFHAWMAAWRHRLSREAVTSEARTAAMRRVNPRFIPRNHRIEQVIAAAMEGDYRPFETLLQVLQRPYENQPDFAAYADPPLPEERVLRTFCGT
jgi:uncharacterized protein YdiU (UPF0061 family)